MLAGATMEAEAPLGGPASLAPLGSTRGAVAVAGVRDVGEARSSNPMRRVATEPHLASEDPRVF